MTQKLLIVTPIHEAGTALLRERADIETVVGGDLSPLGLARDIRDADAVLVRNGQITRQVINAAERLKVVSRHGVGFDNVDVGALTERGIPLTITPKSNAVSVAEHTLYFMLALAKQGPAYDRGTRTGNFEMRYSMRAEDLAGKQLLIVGFGRIGSRVAPRALALGMQVHAYDPYVDEAVIKASDCIPESSLADALPRADVVTMHCLLNDETRALVGPSELALMKRSAFLINTARGGVVDETALEAALREGRLAGAGIDVFETEPSPTDNPLFGLDNVVVSPHSAGVSLQAGIRAATAAVQNVFDAFDGQLDPSVVVNPEVLAKELS